VKLILLLGTALRIAYFIIPRSLWGDEFWVIQKSDLPFMQSIMAYINDVHPPLMAVIYKINATRLFPFIAGILSLYFFSKLSKDKLATFLFAISPYFIHLSGENRGYGFLCLFAILCLMGYRWAFPLALATEHYAWFLLLVMPFALWFIPFLVGSAGLVVYQTATEQVFVTGRGFEWSIFAVCKKLGGLFLQFGGGVQYSFLTPQQAIELFKSHMLYLYLLPAIFIFWARNKKYLKLFIIPIIALLLVYPIRLNARYLPFVGVAYILLISEGYRKFPYKKLSKVIMSLFILMNLSSVLYLFTTRHDPYHREDYLTAARYIEQHASTDDGLIGCKPQVEYYSDRKFQDTGDTIWECYIGNPDMTINKYHWKWQSKKLNKKITECKQISDLVYVLKYEGE